MGRRGKAKRLANPASKMADSVMADHAINFLNFPRPFHEAFLAGKIVCPERECKVLFFEKTGIGHHFRIMHKKEAKKVTGLHDSHSS